jgi:hypothetical protein
MAVAIATVAVVLTVIAAVTTMAPMPAVAARKGRSHKAERTNHRQSGKESLHYNFPCFRVISCIYGPLGVSRTHFSGSSGRHTDRSVTKGWCAW